MLTWRTIREGVSLLMPGVTRGLYTPEEIQSSGAVPVVSRVVDTDAGPSIYDGMVDAVCMAATVNDLDDVGKRIKLACDAGELNEADAKALRECFAGRKAQLTTEVK
jgi:hypothetical protein